VCTLEREIIKVIKEEKRHVAVGDTLERNIHEEMNILTAVKHTAHQKVSHSFAKKSPQMHSERFMYKKGV
jgi:hypothetical protein